MTARINNLTIPTTGFVSLTPAPDADRNSGGAIEGGQGFEVKHEGTTRIKIFDSRKEASSFRTLEVGEVWSADLDYSPTTDQFFAQANDAPGSVSIVQVGVSG